MGGGVKGGGSMENGGWRNLGGINAAKSRFFTCSPLPSPPPPPYHTDIINKPHIRYIWSKYSHEESELYWDEDLSLELQ